MKLLTTSLVFICLFLSNHLMAQDINDKLAESTCECISQKEIAIDPSNNQLEMELGLCIFDALNKYPESMENLDITDEKAMSALGETIGMKMMNYCPDFIMTLGMQALEKEDNQALQNEIATPQQLTIQGTIVELSGSEIQFVTVEDQVTKKRTKLLWWSNFEGAHLLANWGNDAIGKKVTIEYGQLESYSPQLNEYIIRKEILNLTILD